MSLTANRFPIKLLVKYHNQKHKSNVFVSSEWRNEWVLTLIVLTCIDQRYTKEYIKLEPYQNWWRTSWNTVLWKKMIRLSYPINTMPGCHQPYHEPRFPELPELFMERVNPANTTAFTRYNVSCSQPATNWCHKAYFTRILKLFSSDTNIE